MAARSCGCSRCRITSEAVRTFGVTVIGAARVSSTSPSPPSRARREGWGTPALSVVGKRTPPCPPRRRGGRSKPRSIAILPLLRAAALGLAACCAPPLHPAAAQDTPFVPDEWKYGRRQDGSTLQYCLDIRDPDLPVARRIGKAIADALLLTPRPHEIGQNSIGEDIDNNI